MKKIITVSVIVLFALISFAQSEFMISMTASDFGIRGPVRTVKTVYPEDDMDLEDDEYILPAYSVQTFDTAGNLISEIAYDKDGNEINAMFFNYENGKLVSLTGREGGVEQAIGEVVIENGKIVSITVDDIEGESVVAMEYDEKGRLIAQRISGISEGMEMEFAITFKYDDNDNLIEEALEMMGMLLSKTVYVFENNLKVEQLEYMYMFAEPGTEPDPISSVFEYNEMGDVSRKISDSYWGEEKEVSVFEYVYDSMGNYIYKVEFYVFSLEDLEDENWKDSAMIMQEETREIEYY